MKKVMNSNAGSTPARAQCFTAEKAKMEIYSGNLFSMDFTTEAHLVPQKSQKIKALLPILHFSTLRKKIRSVLFILWESSREKFHSGILVMIDLVSTELQSVEGKIFCW